MKNMYKLPSGSDVIEEISIHSLLRYYKNMYSECGQDGILEYIFNKCAIEKGFFVEFGAWDGSYLSNCRALTYKGWSGVSIECDASKFSILQRNMPKGCCAINARVGTGLEAGDGELLIDILKANNIQIDDVVFVSIDVDGSDLEIFENLQFRPPVVLVEGGFNYNPTITSKVQLDYAWKNNQHPLSAVIASAEKFGYKAVCFFQDTYLVRSDYSKFFLNQISLSAKELYNDAWKFASDDLKQYLLQYRSGDSYLIEFEKKYLGYFNSNPNV